jgi:hypothetical protein
VRLLGLHVCPLWEEQDGARRVGMSYEPDHPRVVGWVNVAAVRIAGATYWLLLTKDAARA